MKLPEMRPRAPFAALAIAAAAGTALSDVWETAPGWDVIIVIALAAAAMLRPRTVSCLIFVASAFFALHGIRHHGSEARTLSRCFADGPRAVRAVGIVADEPQTPKKWSRSTTCHFPLKLESIEIGGVSSPVDATVLVRWDGAIPDYGDRIELTGSAENLPPPRNPGEFDLAAHERRRGIYSEILTRYRTDCQITGHGAGNPVWKFSLGARHWIQRQLELDLQDSAPISALIESLVLGMRSDTPEDLRDLFQQTGTVHLFAVSGLNVGMLAWFLLFVTKRLRASRGAAVLVVVPLLVGYALVTGLATSTVRATIMASVFLAGTLFDRPSVSYNSFGAAAFLILLVDTNQLFSIGFQFSFGVVFFVIWLAERFQKKLQPFGQPDRFLPRLLWNWPQRAQEFVWRRFSGAVSVSLASWVGSLPFSAGYFHLFSPTSVLANLLAVPVSFFILTTGVMSAASGLISSSISAVFNNANWCFGHALLRILTFFATLPGGYSYIGRPYLPRPRVCEITVLDVGPGGGAAHVRVDSNDWLVDCGHGYEYDRIVLPYLRTRGVNALDGLVLTVGNAQHIGGAISVFKDFRPPSIVESPLKDLSKSRREIHQDLANRNWGKRIVQRGDVLSLGPNARFRVLYPPAGLQRSAAGDKALVLMLESAGPRVLFMSDSGYFTEQWLLENEHDLAANVLIKGQHSKDLSGTPDFIARVHPQTIVCGLPAQGGTGSLNSWAEDVRAAGIPLFRQDETGAVRITLESDRIRAEAFLNGQVFASRAR